jgi:hypothetical protein
MSDVSAVPVARYTSADASYYAPLLYFKHNDGTQHYPMADIVGTSRRLLSETAAVTDTYSLDAFGRQMSTSGSTVNPYRFGAAWGYITDTASSTQGSGLIQTGAPRFAPDAEERPRFAARGSSTRRTRDRTRQPRLMQRGFDPGYVCSTGRN